MIPSSSIQSLKVGPDELLLTVGYDSVQLQARFILKNGGAAFLNSTANLIWSSSNESIASVNLYGFVKPNGEGIATITVECQGFADEMDVEVVQPTTVATIHGNTYTARPIDVVIVLDRSASMMLKDDEGVTRVERARQAAKMMLANLEDNSQVALVTFAGLRIPGETISDPAITEADATLDLTLTNDLVDIKEALNYFKVSTPCAIMEGEGTRCATGIGAALLVAQAELNSDRHTYGNKQVIFLLTDGCENVNQPAPLPVAEDIKTEGKGIAVVALDVNSCVATLQAIASPGMYFDSPTTYELSFTFGQLPYLVNYREEFYGFYYDGAGGHL